MTTLHKIVFLDHSNEKPNFRMPRFPHEWVEYEHTTEDQVVERLAGATVAVMNRTALKDWQLAQLPDLKLVAIRATGYNGIDIESCKRLNIAVSNVRNWCSTSVPEHVFALILALRRKLLEAAQLVTTGQWTASSTAVMKYALPNDLAGSTLGIIGYGALGKRVAEIGRAFGMRVLIAEHKDVESTRPDRESFEDVISTSDIISLHCPLNDATKNLIGADELQTMRKNALLINCARGGIVDENALAAALRAGEIGGAGFDVLSEEPPINGNPLLDPRLKNVIITPHQAWLSSEALNALDDQLINNIESFVAGKPRNIVN